MLKNADYYMNLIIDELHPLFKAITDEEMVESHEDHGVFERTFLNNCGKEYKMSWSVYYGTPETVRTVFHTAKLLN